MIVLDTHVLIWTGWMPTPTHSLIAASAGARGATLVTADEKLLAWNTDLTRLDARR